MLVKIVYYYADIIKESVGTVLFLRPDLVLDVLTSCSSRSRLLDRSSRILSACFAPCMRFS